MPIDYSQYLNANQHGLDTLNQTRLATLDRPNGVQSFLSGLQGGQERMAARKALSDKQKLEEALRRRQEAQDAASQEERSYQISQRPLDEEKARLGLDKLKYEMTPKPVVAPVAAPMSEYQKERLSLDRERLQHDINTPRSGIQYDKSAVPGSAEWKRVKDVEGKERLETNKNESSLSDIDNTIDYGKSLIDHPGRVGATGASGFLKRNVYGTDSYTFSQKLETFKNKLFIPQVQALKGMGALSDAEGKKLTDSVGALNENMDEKDFLKELNIVLKKLEDTKALVRSRLLTTSQPQPPTSGPKQIKSVEEYNALPPGPYIDPNGVLKRKR